MGSKPIGYSASRVSALIGLNKYKTPDEAWQEIMEEREPGWNKAHGYKLPTPPDSAAIRWGHAFEEPNIKLAEERENQKLLDCEKFFSAKRGQIKLTCHIDGAWYFHRCINSMVIHEGKTTNALAYAQKVDERLRWGEPGTDQVPEEYQIQCAVQRICTRAEQVKLSMLVFPKPVDIWEQEGWIITDKKKEGFTVLEKRKETGEKDEMFNDGELNVYREKIGIDWFNTLFWAKALQQMGYFHTYALTRNERLESAIIEKMQEFHELFVLPGIFPEPQNYDDIRRLLSRPMGTIIATPELAELCSDYSEVTRQLGSAGPLAKRKEELRVAIMSKALKLKRDNWNEPDDKLIIISPDGGYQLASFGTDSDGTQKFRAKRA